MTVQPLVPLGQNIDVQPVTHAALVDYMAGPIYRHLLVYFDNYPPRSLMSSQSRCILYALIRMMQPKAVAEIGTLFAGTAEVMARALWENGSGVVYTADPFGGDRCPAIIAEWPEELRRHVEYHDLNSMDFFAAMDRRRIVLDLVLVDGNHDFEFAMFDLHMAGRLLRPGGIIVMDNSEQSGPFKASRAFLEANPAWRELGASVSTYDPSKPFDRTRASLPATSFVILQAPDHLSITAGPHSQGQSRIDSQQVNGLLLDIVGSAKGTLFYQVFLRGFADGNRWVDEQRTVGKIPIDGAGRVEHRFGQPLIIHAPPADSVFTVEVDLSWLGPAPLALADVPTALR
jgi:predicted O-methyltransferase YrrM